MSDPASRRPLKTRKHPLAKTATQWLIEHNVRPNTISLSSIAMALIGASSLFLSLTDNPISRSFWLVFAALFIQLRLLCNLLDGMVAVEGKQSSPVGEMFNDIPDRIADALFFIAAGYASLHFWGVELGWSAAVLSIMTAYIRTLSASMGAPTLFLGPMAKQHRMALLTAGCLLTALSPWLSFFSHALSFTLIIVVIGSIITCYRRIHATYQYKMPLS